MKKKSLTKPQLSLPISVAIGAGTSILLVLAAAMLIGTMILNETIAESTIGIISKILVFIAVLLGVSLAINLRNKNIMQIGAISSAAVIVVQMLFCAFSYNGISGAMLINSLIILAGAGCAIGIKLSAQKKSSQRKRRYR